MAGLSFIADAMLGKLATWLRLAGYDTLYNTRLDDNELVRLARSTNRLLLTRDRELADRLGSQCYFVTANEPPEQLAEVSTALDLSVSREPRCPRCNMAMTVVDKYAVEGLVPPYVWVNHEEFRRCPTCGRIYWQGTHWRNICRQFDALADV